LRSAWHSRRPSAAPRYWNMARQRYCRQLARYRNTLRVSADPVAKPTEHTRAESRGSRRSKANPAERRTVCWRETDLNPWSLAESPLLAGEPKKASSGSSTPRMRPGPQGDRGAKPSPFYESAEPNIPATSYCGMACPGGTCKTLTIFHDGTHGLSPGTDGSNPASSSGGSRANLTFRGAGLNVTESARPVPRALPSEEIIVLKLKTLFIDPAGSRSALGKR
jgi:hypothetical protein